MVRIPSMSRGAVTVAVLGLALLVAACARNPAGDPGGLGLGMAGTASPGTTQDFVVNVGDRVFFAGEACNRLIWATCAGAQLSGIDTANEVAGLLT